MSSLGLHPPKFNSVLFYAIFFYSQRSTYRCRHRLERGTFSRILRDWYRYSLDGKCQGIDFWDGNADEDIFQLNFQGYRINLLLWNACLVIICARWPFRECSCSSDRRYRETVFLRTFHLLSYSWSTLVETDCFNRYYVAIPWQPLIAMQFILKFLPIVLVVQLTLRIHHDVLARFLISSIDLHYP